MELEQSDVLIERIQDLSPDAERLITDHLEEFEGRRAFIDEGRVAADILGRLISEEPVIIKAWQKEIVEQHYPKAIKSDKKIPPAVRESMLRKISYSRPQVWRVGSLILDKLRIALAQRRSGDRNFLVQAPTDNETETGFVARSKMFRDETHFSSPIDRTAFHVAENRETENETRGLLPDQPLREE